MEELELDREIETVVEALETRGDTDERELATIVAGSGWGPGRFHAATRAAVDEGRARRLPHHRLGPAARR
jgi:hypothetical protein